MRRFMLGAALLSSSGCGNAETEAAPASTTAVADTALLSAESVRIAGFTLATVTREAWRDVVSVPARIALDPASTEPIGSIVEGRVTKVYVMPGDRVQKGAVLLAIHSHELMDARANQAKAKAGMTAAQAHQRVAVSAAERAERLYTIKALALADLERARGAREDADAMVATADAEVRRSDALIEHLVGHDALPSDYDEHWVLIRAPIDGQVVDRQAEPGNVVLVGAPLVTVSRTSSLVLIAHLPDELVRSVRAGSEVHFTTPGTGAQAFRARVTRVFPSVDTLTRTVEVHAAIRDPGSARLRPETFATAGIACAADCGLAIVAPAGALQTFEGDTVVIEAQPRDGGLMLEAVRVRVGRLSREYVEILAGIDTGRTVIHGGAAIAKAEILKRRGGGGGEH